MKYLKNQKSEICLAILFSIITIVGESYKKIDSWDLIFNHIVRSILLFFIYILVFYFVILLLEKIVINLKAKNMTKNKITYSIFEKHPFLYPFIILCLFYLPYLIIKYPGTPGWDFYHFMNNYYQFDQTLTQHFPLLYVFTCVYFIKFGLFLNHPNIGLFLLTCFHALCLITSFALTFYYLKKWNIHYKFRWFLLFFYGLNPLFGNYATTIYHDIAYSSFMLVYILLLTDFLFDRKSITKKKIMILSILSFLICCTRKNGIFIVLPTNLIILFKYSKPYLTKMIRIFMILPIILFLITEVLFSLKYVKTSYLEAMSIPIQTISRYSRDYHNDATFEEQVNITQVLNYEWIAQLYNPTLADPARNKGGNYFATKEELANFFKTWFTLFFRHPDAYIQAVINNTYQLYYPFEKTTYLFFKVKEESNYDTIINFTEPTILKTPKKILENITQTYENIPLIRYIDDPGYYSWILFFILLLVKKYKSKLLPLIPLIMTFLCCIAGPTIDYNSRYAFPIIFSILPLFAFYSSYICQKQKST
jgi:hypothetical protein